MGTGRSFNKAPVVRPKKSVAERKRRDKVHQKRLIALGMPESTVAKLDSSKVRQLLKRPARITAAKA